MNEEELERLYEKIKNTTTEGNLILPKEFLRKFIMMNLLMIKDKKIINDDIYSYRKYNVYELPSDFETLGKDKQDKYLNNLEALIKLFYI